MRYAYKDLGEQPAGSTAVVRWSGSAANVLLLDPVNFSKYVKRWPFIHHAGGRYQHPPAQLSIPHDGRWYVAVDLGRHVTDIAPTVEMLAPPTPGREERARTSATHDTPRKDSSDTVA